MAWKSGWTYRRAIYADTRDLTTTETDIALVLTIADLTGKVESDFDDAIVTDTDGETVLDFYWERKVPANPVCHFRVGSLTHGQAALHIGYLYYGNSSATDQSDEDGVFTSFLARYDLADTSGTIYDSTANNHDSTAEAGVTYASPGKPGTSIALDNSTGAITLPDITAMEMTDVAVGFWARVNSLSVDNGFFYKGTHGANMPLGIFRDLAVAGADAGGSSHTVTCYFYDGDTTHVVATPSLSFYDTDWHHVAVSYTAASGVMSIYLDGVLAITNTKAACNGIKTGTEVCKIGKTGTPTMNGNIDELEIHTSARTASWWRARYQSMTGELLYLGTEESTLSYSVTGIWFPSAPIGSYRNKPPLGAILNTAHPHARGLVLYSLFNEGSGDRVYDLSGYGNHGTLTNMDPATDWVPGPDGWALDFDASNDHVLMSSTFDVTAPWSLLVRLYCIPNGQYRVAVGCCSATNYAMALGMDSDNSDIALRHYLTSGDDATVSGAIAANTWATVVAAYDGSSRYLWVDGIAQASASPTGTGTSGVRMTIGARSDFSATRYWSGSIGCVAIWSRALSAAEVAQVSMDPYCLARPARGFWLVEEVAGGYPWWLDKYPARWAASTTGRVIMPEHVGALGVR